MTDTNNDAGPPRVCLLIGGAGGIGRATAARLLSGGMTVHLASRSDERLKQASAELAELGLPGTVRTHTVDATDFDAVESLVGQIDDAEGLHAAANLAGSIILKPAHLTSADEFSEHMDLNIRTAFALVRAAAIRMQRGRAKDGIDRSIALMSTTAALTGLPNHELIAAAKGAVTGLVRAAASTYASGGVRVNAVAPGLVDTPMAERITSNGASLEASRAMHPLGRIGTPEDIAPLLAWLLGADSGFATGQVYAVDGGMSAVRGRPAR